MCARAPTVPVRNFLRRRFDRRSSRRIDFSVTRNCDLQIILTLNRRGLDAWSKSGQGRAPLELLACEHASHFIFLHAEYLNLKPISAGINFANADIQTTSAHAVIADHRAPDWLYFTALPSRRQTAATAKSAVATPQCLTGTQMRLRPTARH